MAVLGGLKFIDLSSVAGAVEGQACFMRLLCILAQPNLEGNEGVSWTIRQT